MERGSLVGLRASADRESAPCRARPAALTAGLGVLTAVVLASIGLLGSGPAAGSGGGARTRACTQRQIVATAQLAVVSKSSTSVPGAVELRNSSSTRCTLIGVPAVGIVDTSGRVVPTFQAPTRPSAGKPVSLSPSRSPTAAFSITWSNWSCPAGSFSITVRFAGWTQSRTAPTGSATTTACTQTNSTIYAGEVARLSGG